MSYMYYSPHQPCLKIDQSICVVRGKCLTPISKSQSAPSSNVSATACFHAFSLVCWLQLWSHRLWYKLCLILHTERYQHSNIVLTWVLVRTVIIVVVIKIGRVVDALYRYLDRRRDVAVDHLCNNIWNDQICLDVVFHSYSHHDSLRSLHAFLSYCTHHTSRYTHSRLYNALRGGWHAPLQSVITFSIYSWAHILSGSFRIDILKES